MDLLNIRSADPEIQRRGRILAMILLGMVISTVLLPIYNVIFGETRWILTQIATTIIMAGLFFANRYGFVRVCSIILAFIATTGPFIIFDPPLLRNNYVVMLIPILIVSFILVAWGSILVATIVIIATVIYFQPAEPPIVSIVGLLITSVIMYLFADSLERANRESSEHAAALVVTNAALATTTEEQQALLEEQEHILKDQQQLLAAIQDLSVTVLQVADHVLLCPLVGKLTNARMKVVLSSLLAAVGSYRANRLILDLTGQKNVTQGAVDMIFRLVQAVRLLGCEVVLTGISAQLATQLVQNKNNHGLSDVLTVSSLQQGLELALHQ